MAHGMGPIKNDGHVPQRNDSAGKPWERPTGVPISGKVTGGRPCHYLRKGYDDGQRHG